MIPYGRQEVTQADVDAVIDVLRSDFLTQGPVVPRFEEAVARSCGAAHAVAVHSGTAALHVACRALGLGPGDELWTSPITFVASANCALYCGARVDFVDVDRATGRISVAALERKLIDGERTGRRPKIVVPVHLGGEPCEMEAIATLAARFGFKVIEDACHAVGGKYRQERIGACRYSDITVFSFHPVKVITTGEGGMAMTNDPALAASMTLLRSHGITRDPQDMTRPSDGSWYYEQIDLGFNYRMTDLQAALGLSQLERLDRYVARRHDLARRYDDLLAGLPVATPVRDPANLSGLHLYTIRLDLARLAVSRRAVVDAMRARGIAVNVHYIPVHTQPYFQKAGFGRGDFPEAERYYAEVITLPMYPTLSETQQTEVVAALRETLR
jgi:UDP-4-amino-4,6-dideoxy-N-acetyl-beta-L-altrosamine transaminase